MNSTGRVQTIMTSGPHTNTIARTLCMTAGTNGNSAAQRYERFKEIYARYVQGQAVSARTGWLRQRLGSDVNDTLCGRIDMKSIGTGIYAKLETHQGALTGFQRIFYAGDDHQKRFVFPFANLLRDSFFRVRAIDEVQPNCIMLCEGIATALSLALVWPGEIRAALCAQNLAATRAVIPGSVIIAHDMDCFKPHVGNVGLHAAKRCLRKGDALIRPYFHMDDMDQKPTDFNDVLRLYGIDELYRQTRNIIEYR